MIDSIEYLEYNFVKDYGKFKKEYSTLKQGSGTFLAVGAMNITYFKMYFVRTIQHVYH